jgi:TRAP-type C4-dicarboxylate transport system, small permease component
VTKYACETKHILLINFEVISSKWFNSLPVEYQKILEEECNRAGLEVSRRYLNEIDPRNLEVLKAAGMTLIPESEIDMAAFKAAGEKAYQKLGILDVRDQVYKELGKKNKPWRQLLFEEGLPEVWRPRRLVQGGAKRFLSLFIKEYHEKILRVYLQGRSIPGGPLFFHILLLNFLAAVARTFDHPINWSQDMSLFLFAWSVFLSADAAFRADKLVNIDLLSSRFSASAKRVFSILIYCIILVFLGTLIWYGIKLSLFSRRRVFQGNSRFQLQLGDHQHPRGRSSHGDHIDPQAQGSPDPAPREFRRSRKGGCLICCWSP